MLRRAAAVLLVLLAVPSALSAGCGGKVEAPLKEKASNSPPQPAGGEASPHAADVIMNGRSVMSAWVEHWGYTWEGPVEKHGYAIDFRELDSSDIPGSFAANVENLLPGTIAFFKYCFEDFDGSNLEQRELEVKEVIAEARGKGLRLIIGNALPVRRQDGRPEMLEEYRDFNAFLEAKAAGDPNVWVFDFYVVLAGADGFLKPEYATEDSHPNQKAYAQLDRSFFPLLDTITGG